MNRTIATAALLVLTAGTTTAQTIQRDDIAVGWSTFGTIGTPVTGYTQASLDNTIGIYRPTPTLPFAVQPDTFNQIPGVQTVQWDNSGGIRKSGQYLLGMDFGGNPTGTQITGFGFRLYQYAANATTTPAFKVMFNGSIPGAAPVSPTWSDFPTLEITRGSSLCVSPDNTRIAIMGTDIADVTVFDYNAAAGSISNGRQSISNVYLPGNVTQALVWRGNSELIAIAIDGAIFSVNPTTMATAGIGSWTPTPNGLSGPRFLQAAYEPSVSPFIFVWQSSFTTPVTTNELAVLDPRNNAFTVVSRSNFSTSNNTARGVALASNGDLFLTEFGGLAAPAGNPRISRVANAAALALAASTGGPAIPDNSSVEVFSVPNTVFASSFNAIDIAIGAPAITAGCYANCDGSTTAPVLGPADFSCFLTRFRAGEAYANCDGSTIAPVLGPADFSCFLTKFRAGC